MHGRGILADKLERFCRHQAIFDQPLIVAVSGGPDSVALAHALAQRRTSAARSERLLVLAHLNHQLRGGDSDADEHFVRALQETLKPSVLGRLELCCERRAVRARARQDHGNLENVGRKVRYAWLADVARRFGAPFVATGHTADDQAETVLHRLLRGTGLNGLRGIAARRTLTPGIELLRPLLDVTRAEVLEYLKCAGQAYREDGSNRDRQFTRNRIRHELLPCLARDYNPAIAAVLGRLAEQAAAVYEDQETRARALLTEAERPRVGPLLVFAASPLAGTSRQLVRELFRLVWGREGWPRGGMGFREWDGLAALAFGERVAVDLPNGIQARRRQQVVQIGPPAPPCRPGKTKEKEG